MEMILKTGRYGTATVGYAGMVSFSYVKRSGFAVKLGYIKVISPVKSTFSKSVVTLKEKKNIFFRKKSIDIGKVDGLEHRILQIEKRLEQIEKLGVGKPLNRKIVTQKKELKKEKRALLQVLVNENKMIRD